MLVNLKEILQVAEKGNIAIGAYNTPNLETLMAVLGKAEQNDVPIIIMHAQVHEGIMPLDVIGPIMVKMASRSSVPVCVHCDHGVSLDYLRRALDLGFTSIMYDGSSLPYEENAKNSCKAVWMAREYSASVEAEIGVVGGYEAEADSGSKVKEEYTDPALAKSFAQDTGIDALACSFGTVHGFYSKEPKLDFERIKQIKELTGLPLVMHGGSGVNHEDYIKSIDCGIRKINYYSYMSNAGVISAKELLDTGKVRYYHDLSNAAAGGMAEDVNKSMQVFYKINKGG